jgi:hypothetical protein
MMASPAKPTRISSRFAELRASSEMGIVAYLTAGDPSLEATEKFVLALAEAGADVIELGVPFSDPLADGPTIQRASERALKNNSTVAGVIDLVREIRRPIQQPATFIVLFSYYNPIFQMGLEKFAAAASWPEPTACSSPISRPKNPETIAAFWQRIISIPFFLPRRRHRRSPGKIAACSPAFSI